MNFLWNVLKQTVERPKTPNQEHIENIYQEYTRPSRLLQSFTNLSNTVIHTALSGQAKFLFEILQNVDDAFEDPDQKIEVEFILKDDYFIVHHDGKGFDYNDVERICDYASQIEEVKATDLSKTGYKGLGFKSLFNLSDTIYIHSNGYCFRFDKTHWKDWQEKPWQIIPIWCQYNELPLHAIFPYDQPVNIILRINDADQLETQIRELVNHPDLLLFLHRVKEVSFNLNGETHNFKRISEKFKMFNKIYFYDGEDLKSTWLTKPYNCTIPQNLKNLIQNESNFIFPDKIKTAKEVKTTFAVRCNSNMESISSIKGLLYSTLPTQLNITLPYHINSSFILNLDRTQLHENKWNEYLLNQIGGQQLDLLRLLAGIDFIKKDVISIFRHKIHHPFPIFSRAYSYGFKAKSKKIGWLPSFQNTRLLKLNEAWTDETEFFKQNFEFIRDDICPHLIDYELKNQTILSTEENQISRFSYKDLFDNFADKYYPQLTEKSYLDFISYIYRKLKDLHPQGEIIKEFKKLPFLRSKEKTFVSIEKAFIEDEKKVIPNFMQLNNVVVDNRYIPSNDADLIKEWFMQLGANKVNDTQIIHEHVLKWIVSYTLREHMNEKNHIEILNFISCNIDILSLAELDKVKAGIILLTVTNEFKLAKECYFPYAFPVVFADIIPKEIVISPSYSISDMKDFFIKVGVREKFPPIDVVRRSILTWIKKNILREKLTVENYPLIIEYLAEEYSSFKYELLLNEQKELRKLLILTIKGRFEEARFCYFDSAFSKITGLNIDIQRCNEIAKGTLSKNAIDFLSEIGVSDKIKPTEIIRNTVLKWINENIIKKKVTRENYHGILEFIANNWDTTDHSLKGLKSMLRLDEIQKIKGMLILTNDETFQEIRRCYFDSAVPNVKGLEDAFPKIISRGNLSDTVVEFLLKIGVRDNLKPVEVIRITVLKWINENVIEEKVTEDNYKDILKYIAENWDTTDLSSSLISSLNRNEMEDMKKMVVLTINKTFQEIRNCFFDSAVPNFKGVEDIFPKNVIIMKENLSDTIVEFLLKIGVRDRLEPVDVIRNTVLKWIKSEVIKEYLTEVNCKNILQYIASHWNTTELLSNDLKSLLTKKEMEDIMKMPILVSDETFQELRFCYLDSAVPNVKGLEEIIPKSILINRERYSSTVVEFLSQIGVPDKLEPIEVIRKSILKWINENVIGNKVTEDNYKQILEYIAQNWVSTDPSYNGLELLLSFKDMNDIRKMLVLTSDDTFQEIGFCVFDSAVPNVNGIENIIPKRFVIIRDCLSDSIVEFLLRIGVPDRLDPVNVMRITVFNWIDENLIFQKVTENNYIHILEYIAKNWVTTDHSDDGLKTLLSSKEKNKIKRMLILTSDGTFQEIGLCVFDSALPNVNGIEDAFSKKFIIIRNSLTDTIIEFLLKIGVRDKLEPVEVIRKTVFKWIDENLILQKLTENNYINILEYIANNWDSTDNSADGLETLFSSKEKNKMKRMLILTSDGTFQEIGLCVFDSALPNVNGIEDAFPKKFVINKNSLSDSIIKFLLKIGVQDRLDPVEVIRITVLKWINESMITQKITKNNYIHILEYIVNNWESTNDFSNGLKSLLSWIEVKRMLILTSDGTFQEIGFCFFDSAVPNINGLENAISKSFVIIRDSLTDSIIEFLLKIGVRDKLEPVEVIRKTVLKWINESVITQRVTEHNYIHILEYIANNWDTPEDSTNSLTSLLSSKEKIEMKRMLILTSDGTFQEIRLCFFDSAVPNVNGLDEVIPPKNVIVKNTLSEKVIDFLLEMNVPTSMEPSEVIRKTVLKWINNKVLREKVSKDNFKDILEYIAEHWYNTNINSGLKTELTNEEREKIKDMLVLTSDGTFQEIRFCYFDSALPNVSGLIDDFSESIIIKEYFCKSVIKCLQIFGVIEKVEPDEVIRKTIITWINRNIAKNKITPHNHKNILTYIVDNWDTIDNSSSPGLKILLNSEEKKVLKKLPILTKTDCFREAEGCYWQFYTSDDGQQEKVPNLDCIISDSQLVSTEYDINIYKPLLDKLGVQEPEFTTIYEKYSEHLRDSKSTLWFLSMLTKYWKRKSCCENDELLTRLKDKFSSGPYLLAKNGKMHLSSELYSSRFRSIYNIVPHIFPLLAYDDLPLDLEDWLGFKTMFELACIVKLSSVVSESFELGEKDTKLFFSTLLEQLRPKKKFDIEQYSFNLLSAESIFKPAKELYYFEKENATCDLKSCYLKRIHGMSHEETLELAVLCGVNILPYDKTFLFVKEKIDDSLKKFYMEKLPFIAVQEAIELNENPLITLKRLYDSISNIKFYHCQKIFVRYPFGDSCFSRFFCDNFNIYCDGKWQSKRAKIHKYLKKQLNIETDIEDTLDMDPFTDKEKWFEDHGGKAKNYYYSVEDEIKILSG